MKTLVATLIATLSFSVFANTYSGFDQDGSKCSIKIISQTPNKIVVKLKGENLNKKVKLNYLESHSSYYTSIDREYGSVMGVELGSIMFARVDLDESTFTYYRSGFLLSKEIDVTCDFQ